MKKKYDLNLNMIILVIVIVVIVMVGGAYVYNASSSSSKADETTEDYDTQTYTIKSNPIKFDPTLPPKPKETTKKKDSMFSKYFNKKLKTFDPVYDEPRSEQQQSEQQSQPEQQQSEQQSQSEQSQYNTNELIPFYRSTSKPLEVQQTQPSETTPVSAPGSDRIENLTPNEKVFKVFNEIGLEPKTCKRGGKTTSNKCKDGSYGPKAWKDAIRRKIFKDKAIVDEIFTDGEVVNITTKNEKFVNLRETLLTLDENWNQNKDIPDEVWGKLQEMYKTGENELVAAIKEDIEKINKEINETASKGGGSSDVEETTDSLTAQINKEIKFSKIKELVKRFFKIMRPDQKKKLNE